MDKHLKILFVEDSPNDVEMIHREIRRAGIEFTAKIVQTRDEAKAHALSLKENFEAGETVIDLSNVRQSVIVVDNRGIESAFDASSSRI